VTGAADLYSLGKVIYFMISGGVTLPREDHRDSAIDLQLKGGGYELLWLLLDRLICPLKHRMASAVEVVKRLEEIERWSRRPAVLVPEAAAASLSRIVEADIHRETVQRENRGIRERRETEFRGVADSLRKWLTEQIRTQAEHLRRPDTVECICTSEAPPKKLPRDWNSTFGREYFKPVWSVDLNVRRPKSFPPGDHWLTLILARKREVGIHVGDQIPQELDKPVEARLIPMYFRSQDWCGFLSWPQIVRAAPVRDRFGRSLATQMQAERVRKGFYGQSVTIYLEIDLAAWPGDIEKYEKLIGESLEVFLAYIEAAPSILGL
jgi:hypothetical protein